MPLLSSMTVRIEITSEGLQTVVSVAGRLLATGATELRRICSAIGGEFVLDLSGLRSADSEGISIIRELVGEGARLRATSPFIQLLIAENGD